MFQIPRTTPPSQLYASKGRFVPLENSCKGPIRPLCIKRDGERKNVRRYKSVSDKSQIFLKERNKRTNASRLLKVKTSAIANQASCSSPFKPEKQDNRILNVTARQILDSRGNPTVEADVTTPLGVFRASVPSGASTGIYEAVELRDGDKGCYHGRSVLKVVRNIEEIIGPAIKGSDPRDQRALDERLLELDGTVNKARLGANATLAVSMAVCRAGASALNVPLYRHLASLAGNRKLILPVPSFNVINGGRHAGNALAFQEFMILPTGAASFAEGLRMGAETYHTLKKLVCARYGSNACNVGDEGGFAPGGIVSNEEGVKLVYDAIKEAGFEGRMKIGVDAAASEFYRQTQASANGEGGALTNEEGYYDLGFKQRERGGGKEDEVKIGQKNINSNKLIKSKAEMLELYLNLTKNYPIAFIEDPFEQDDWEPAKRLTAAGACLVIGDDMLCTNPSRVKKGIESKCVNSLLLKLNQIGTISEATEAVRQAKAAGWGVMTSHRSGETEDTFIADLAVGLATGLIKTGAPCRSERTAKYNQLLRIEEELLRRGGMNEWKEAGENEGKYAGKDELWKGIKW